MALRKKKTEEIVSEERPVTQVVEVVEEESKKEEMIDLPKEQKEEVEDLFEKETSQVPQEISVKIQPKRKLWVWVLVVLALASIVGIGMMFVRGDSSGTAPTPTPTPIPSPTPAPVLDRADLTVEVLNGGGAVGAAGKMRDFLKEKGYSVESVGNTDEYTYEETEILVKPDKEAYLSLLKEDLAADYLIGSTAATLEEDASYDARVIVGKE